MSEVNRRESSALSSLAAGGAALAGCGAPGGGRAGAAGAAGGHADQIVTNATVHTIDDDNPRAEALAVKNGRFLAAGSNADIANLAGPGTERIDAAGGTVVPGFIDAHNHPSSAGMRHLTQVDMNIRTIAGMQSALRERAQNTPPGEWVVGFLYDDTKIEDGATAQPARHRRGRAQPPPSKSRTAAGTRASTTRWRSNSRESAWTRRTRPAATSTARTAS